MIAGAGDMCNQGPPAIKAQSCKATGDYLASISASLNKVYNLGDNVYDNGTLSQYDEFYDDYWGVRPDGVNLKTKTLPTVGNHEENDAYTGYCSYFGAAAACDATATSMNYVVDVGSWRIVHVNNNGGLSQNKNDIAPWLVTALGNARTAGDSTVVLYHQPRWSSPCSGCHGDNSHSQDIWAAAVNNGADVVLNGHDHHYEKFGTMDANGNYSASGLREFVVGTGGGTLDANSTNPHAMSEVRLAESGVLVLDLNSNGTYDYEFRSPSGLVLDSGNAVAARS